MPISIDRNGFAQLEPRRNPQSRDSLVPGKILTVSGWRSFGIVQRTRTFASIHSWAWDSTWWGVARLAFSAVA